MRNLRRVAVINVGVAVLTVGGRLALRPADQISPVTDILFPLAIGIATYFGGRLNGAVWLLAPVERLFAQRAGTDAFVSFAECILVYAFTSVVITREITAARDRDRLRALIASMKDVVLRLDGDGNYLQVLQPVGLLRPPAELLGRNVRDFIPPDDADVLLSKIAEALQTQSTVMVAYKLPTAAGPRFVEAAISPIDRREVVSVARDVTEAKAHHDALQRLNAQLEERVAARTRDLADTVAALGHEVDARVRAIEALTESQERFHLIARATNDVFWDWDLATNHLWFSDSYAERFGGPPPTIDGWMSRIHPNDRDRVSQKLDAALAAPDVKFIAEYHYQREDGSYAVVLDRSYIVRNSEGQATRMVGALIDLTEYRRLAERLEQEKRISSLGRIAASIAHEFNNVLMAIQANLEAVRRFGVDARVNVHLERVFSAVGRSKSITEQILSYTRPAVPEKRSILVERFLTDWKDEISLVLPPSISLSVKSSSPHLRVEADPLQIAQVLTNLALNARDAMLPEGGALHVEGFAASETDFDGTTRQIVRFRIADTGCGMSAEQLSHAFEPLYTTKRHGTGLGLAVSQQIAKQHGGYLSAETALGRGTTFHLVLPRSADVQPNERVEERLDFSCRRILLVEDDPAIAAGLTTLLEAADVEVSVAHDGEAAVAQAMASPPDCLILDIGLPDMDGTEVFARIRDRQTELPVVFSSGHADATRLQPYLQLERVALLIKPYTFEQLSATLSAVSS